MEKKIKRVVVKIGTSAVESKGVKKISEKISAMIENDFSVVLVSSGASGKGRKAHHDVEGKDKKLSSKEYASIGQPILISEYGTEFEKRGVKVAQAMVAKETNKIVLENLMNHGYLPIVNGNDFENPADLMWGDNDSLAGDVALKIQADVLVIITDVDGVYDKNPRQDKTAQKLERLQEISDDLLENSKSTGSEGGTGGMYTKLITAKNLIEKNVSVYITESLRDAEEFIKSDTDINYKGTFIQNKVNKKW